MKYILIFIIAFYSSYSISQNNLVYDVSVTTSFSPPSIVVGAKANYEVSFCNLTPTGLTVPVNKVRINVSFGSGYDGDTPPTGSMASSFDWYDIGTGWFGINNTPIPFPSCGPILFEVTGLNISSTYSNVFAKITSPDSDNVPQNNTSSAGLVVTAPLPIDLTSFTAKSIECNTVLLNWETASESNNDYMEVMRSKDGTTFLPVGRVKGTNKPGSASYSFTDESGLAGGSRYFYRLKQVDFDGTAKLFKPVAVQNICQTIDQAFSIYPNPAVDKTYITLEGFNENDKVALEITNTLGEVVMTIDNASVSAPNELKLTNLPSGVYNVKLTGYDYITSKRFIKVF